MRRVWPLLGLLLAGWVCSWLPLGLWQGDPTRLLRPGSPDHLRIPYLVSLYFWLVAASALCWRRYRPKWVAWGRVNDFAYGFALGAGFLLLQRGFLWAFGWWSPVDPFPWAILGVALITSPLLAGAEELVFRGYLYGVLREEWGVGRAAVSVNLLFALAHLFRPGQLPYKLMLGLGLFFIGLLLTLALERHQRLLVPIGIHSAWVVAIIVDPPTRTVPGWWAGWEGESVTGLLSWLLLPAMAWYILKSTANSR